MPALKSDMTTPSFRGAIDSERWFTSNRAIAMGVAALASHSRLTHSLVATHGKAHTGNPWNETVDTLASASVPGIQRFQWPFGLALAPLPALASLHAAQSVQMCQAQGLMLRGECALSSCGDPPSWIPRLP